MKKFLLTTTLSIFLFIGSVAHAVQYDDFEINQQLNQSQIKNLSTDYIQNYFSSKLPHVVIDDLMGDDITPLQREYILFNLLTEISQQPPQAFHQQFVDQMKTYPILATRAADEGHLPVAVFSLNSKAHGIENIWSAYRSEQHFNQLFKTDMHLAVTAIQAILAQDSSQRRPQWLGIKNSIAALAEKSLDQLAQHLSNSVQANAGLDDLISHVALFTGRAELIDKALLSKQPSIRELTLRQLTAYLPAPLAKSLLLENARTGLDRKFSTSLLSQFNADNDVEVFLADQLSNKLTAANAAFALSQSDSLSLPQLLKNRYFISTDESEKNHLILALKLNTSSAAKLALDDLLKHIEKGSTASKWLKSFETKVSGEQP